MFLKRFFKTGLLIYTMNYRPIISIIIKTAVINENSTALFQALIFKNNLFNAKYVSSHVFHYTSHKRNIKGII